jgi:hypothetical protein
MESLTFLVVSRKPRVKSFLLFGKFLFAGLYSFSLTGLVMRLLLFPFTEELIYQTRSGFTTHTFLQEAAERLLVRSKFFAEEFPPGVVETLVDFGFLDLYERKPGANKALPIAHAPEDSEPDELQQELTLMEIRAKRARKAHPENQYPVVVEYVQRFSENRAEKEQLLRDSLFPYSKEDKENPSLLGFFMGVRPAGTYEPLPTQEEIEALLGWDAAHPEAVEARRQRLDIARRFLALEP